MTSPLVDSSAPRRRSRFTSAFEVENFPRGEVRRHTVGEPSKEVRALPFYGLVPKGRVEQLKWRHYVRERTAEDLEFRKKINEMCRRDILFFANTMLAVFEPRPFSRVLPMNTWPDQDDAIVHMDECFGVRECGREKSRGVGASYDLLTISLHKWLYWRRCKIGFVSKDKDSVDKMGDENTLMVKLDKMYEFLPFWMRRTKDGSKLLDRTYSDHRFLNVQNGSAIFGFPATADVATGGRMTAVFLDEFGKFPKGDDTHALASTQHVTNCRYFISTYKGNSNEFYKLMNPKKGEESTMLKIISDWKDNPERTKGLYTSRGGVLEILDKEYEFPEGYQFILDGKVRSAWYDAEWWRPGATPLAIAEELDRDPRGSVSKFFSAYALQVQSHFLMPPTFRGELNLKEPKNPVFMPGPQGRMKVWMPLDAGYDPGYSGPYQLYCDIAAGTGESCSNSVIQVIDQARKEQVVCIATNDIEPQDLADYAVGVARWLSNGRGDKACRIGFESNGPLASQFKKRLRKSGYGNLYWDYIKDDTGKKQGKKLGYNNQDKGEELLSQLNKGMMVANIMIHDDDTMKECDEYEYGTTGVLVHQPSHDSEDGAVKGKAHGDRAIGISGAFMMHEDKPIPAGKKLEMPPPPGSPADLFAKREEHRRRHQNPWEAVHEDLAQAMGSFQSW